VLSIAKIQGIFGAIIGVFVGLMFALIGSIASMSDAGASNSLLAMGLGGVILFPIIYGLSGFLGGVLVGFMYNLVAPKIGGIKIELK